MTPVENTENLFREDVVIANGGNVAPAIATEGRALIGVQMPAGWDAAKLGFEVSLDGSTFRTVYDNAGALLQATAAAAEYIAFPLDSAVFGPWLKIKSVSAANAAVNQTANRTLTLLFRRLFGGV